MNDRISNVVAWILVEKDCDVITASNLALSIEKCSDNLVRMGVLMRELDMPKGAVSEWLKRFDYQDQSLMPFRAAS